MNRTIIAIIAAMLLFQVSFAQKPDLSGLSLENKESYEWLKKQERKNDRAATRLLVGGLVVGGVGLVTTVTGGMGGNKSSIGPIVFFTGAAAVLASIPCAIAAGNKKQKAKLLLKGETAQFNFSPTGQLGYPAVGLRVRL